MGPGIVLSSMKSPLKAQLLNSRNSQFNYKDDNNGADYIKHINTDCVSGCLHDLI